jgi:hypothetical protein
MNSILININDLEEKIEDVEISVSSLNNDDRCEIHILKSVSNLFITNCSINCNNINKNILENGPLDIVIVINEDKYFKKLYDISYCNYIQKNNVINPEKAYFSDLKLTVGDI